jgi:hypothetical protein
MTRRYEFSIMMPFSEHSDTWDVIYKPIRACTRARWHILVKGYADGHIAGEIPGAGAGWSGIWRGRGGLQAGWGEAGTGEG